MTVNKPRHLAIDATLDALTILEGHEPGSLGMTNLLCFASDRGTSFVAKVTMTVIEPGTGKELGVNADVKFVRQKNDHMEPTHIDMVVHREDGLPRQYSSDIRLINRKMHALGSRQ